MATFVRKNCKPIIVLLVGIILILLLVLITDIHLMQVDQKMQRIINQ